MQWLGLRFVLPRSQPRQPQGTLWRAHLQHQGLELARLEHALLEPAHALHQGLWLGQPQEARLRLVPLQPGQWGLHLPLPGQRRVHLQLVGRS